MVFDFLPGTNLKEVAPTGSLSLDDAINQLSWAVLTDIAICNHAWFPISTLDEPGHHQNRPMKTSPSKPSTPSLLETASHPPTLPQPEQRARPDHYLAHTTPSQGPGVPLAQRIMLGNLDACFHAHQLVATEETTQLTQQLEELISLIKQTRTSNPLNRASLERKIQLQTQLARMIEGLPLSALSRQQRPT